MLRCFAKTLVGNAKQWLKGYPPNSFKNWDEFQPEFLKRFYPTPKFSREKVEIKSFKKEQEEPKYQAWKPTIEDRSNCTIWIDDAMKYRGESPKEPVEAYDESLKDLKEAAEEFKQLVRNLKVKNRKVPCSLENIWKNNSPRSVVATRHNKEIEDLPIQEEKKLIKEKKPEREIAKEGKILEEEAKEEENTIFLDTADATRRAPEPRDAQVPTEEFQSTQLPENLKYPEDDCNNHMLRKVNEEGNKEEAKGDSDSDKPTRRAEHPRNAHTLGPNVQILQFLDTGEYVYLIDETDTPEIVSDYWKSSAKDKPIKRLMQVHAPESRLRVFMVQKDLRKEPPKPPEVPILSTPLLKLLKVPIIPPQQRKEEEKYQRFIDEANSTKNHLPLIETMSIVLRKIKYANVKAVEEYMEREQEYRCVVGRKKNVQAKDGYECERDKWKARKQGEGSKVKEGVKASPDAKGTT